jgi:hypothetical protein
MTAKLGDTVREKVGLRCEATVVKKERIPNYKGNGMQTVYTIRIGGVVQEKKYRSYELEVKYDT